MVSIMTPSVRCRPRVAASQAASAAARLWPSCCCVSRPCCSLLKALLLLLASAPALRRSRTTQPRPRHPPVALRRAVLSSFCAAGSWTAPFARLVRLEALQGPSSPSPLVGAVWFALCRPSPVPSRRARRQVSRCASRSPPPPTPRPPLGEGGSLWEGGARSLLRRRAPPTKSRAAAHPLHQTTRAFSSTRPAGLFSPSRPLSGP